MRKIIQVSVMAFAGLLATEACKAKKNTETVAATPTVQVKPKSICDSMTVTYTAHVKPIMDEHCVNACHNARKRAGGIDLSTYELIKYESNGIRFMGTMMHEEFMSPMPKNKPKLADSTLRVVKCWLENGRPL